MRDPKDKDTKKIALGTMSKSDKGKGEDGFVVQRGVLWDTGKGAGGTLQVVGWGLSELFGAVLTICPK